MRGTVITAIVAALLLLAVGSRHNAEAQAFAPRGWEYKVVFGELREKQWGNDRPHQQIMQDLLNKEGAEGWELVRSAESSHSGIYDLIFKRPR